MGKLTEKVAIITGASGGIGAAAARLFVARVPRHVCVRRDEVGRAWHE
jgi:NAD(P)-dependent dehydrogenase (short-subunit alcohol dehydrogenase family)